MNSPDYSQTLDEFAANQQDSREASHGLPAGANTIATMLFTTGLIKQHASDPTALVFSPYHLPQ